MKIKMYKKIFSIKEIIFGAIALLILSITTASANPSQVSPPFTIKLGKSSFYKNEPCVAKFAFKYKNKLFEPIVSVPFNNTKSPINAIVKSKSKTDVLEYVSLYILKLNGSEVTGISNSARIKIMRNPDEIKNIHVWFEKDTNGNRTILRTKVIKHKLKR